MKLIRYGPPGGERPAALLDADHALDLTEVIADIGPASLSSTSLDALRAHVANATEPIIEVPGTRIGPPLSRPGKIICAGLNYRDHAAETDNAEPSEPVLFMKAPNSITGPEDDIVIPADSATTDYEVELALVIGSPAFRLTSPEAAHTAIAGYTISNDVSERTYQIHRGGQWVKGKSLPTFNPLGPWLVTADEISDPQALRLTLRVNGETRQDSSTRQMIFSADYLVYYISQFMALEPGDLINTGTPAGVALGADPSWYLRPGDTVTTAIESLGSQHNRVAHEAASPPD
jgi:2-keto-4-pentenoate hydratase/2-oxohepta-3-ene-1,7-dioic acid hydratase in catechol pathway